MFPAIGDVHQNVGLTLALRLRLSSPSLIQHYLISIQLQQTQQDLREQELLELGDAARLEQWKHQQQWQEAWLQKNEEALQEAKRRQLEGTDWQEEQIR